MMTILARSIRSRNPRPPWGGRATGYRLTLGGFKASRNPRPPWGGRATLIVSPLSGSLNLAIRARPGEGERQDPWVYALLSRYLAIRARPGEGERRLCERVPETQYRSQSAPALGRASDAFLLKALTQAKNSQSAPALGRASDPAGVVMVLLEAARNPRPPWGGRATDLGAGDRLQALLAIRARPGEGERHEHVYSKIPVIGSQSAPALGRASDAGRENLFRRRQLAIRARPGEGERQSIGLTLLRSYYSQSAPALGRASDSIDRWS